MAPHSSTLAWKIPWTEEPGGLQSVGSLRVGHDWATSLSLFTFMHWGRKWHPIPVFLPGESQGRGAWWAAVYGVRHDWSDFVVVATFITTCILEFESWVFFSNIFEEGFIPIIFSVLYRTENFSLKISCFSDTILWRMEYKTYKLCPCKHTDAVLLIW